MVIVKKITQEEIDEMNDQLNAEIEYDIAAERYLRDNTSDVQLIAFCNTQIEMLKSRRV
jgi:hypothetical protein